jgi:hypothetical protein
MNLETGVHIPNAAQRIIEVVDAQHIAQIRLIVITKGGHPIHVRHFGGQFIIERQWNLFTILLRNEFLDAVLEFLLFVSAVMTIRLSVGIGCIFVPLWIVKHRVQRPLGIAANGSPFGALVRLKTFTT